MYTLSQVLGTRYQPAGWSPELCASLVVPILRVQIDQAWQADLHFASHLHPSFQPNDRGKRCACLPTPVPHRYDATCRPHKTSRETCSLPAIVMSQVWWPTHSMPDSA